MLMKKIFLCLFVLFVGSIQLWAASVNEEQARKIAANFTRVIPSLRSAAKDAGELTTAYVSLRNDGLSRFYVFNRGKSNGFVIVSGDDRAEAVLGYTDNGSFDIDNIPPNMKWWLNEYANQMDALYNGAYGDMRFLRSGTESSSNLRQTSSDVVAPLLGEIKWDQSEPFNNMCPIYEGKNSVTGCVATAMAQIMRYHKHPKQGKGSHTYYWSEGGQELTVNFDGANYDWDNMLPTYGMARVDLGDNEPEKWWPEEWWPEGWQPDKAPTQTEKDAVATLMYHCGVSVEMKYTSKVSGTPSVNVPNALYKYFGYDGGMALHYRNGCSSEEWEELVRRELDAGRPLYYAGSTPDNGGHAFVCDGYDANGFFHINWGWAGAYDGYFLLHALEPEGQGTGGYEGGYNLHQGILTGIQPDEGGVPDNGAQILSTGLIPVNDVVTKGNSLLFESERIESENWISDAVRFNLGLLFYNGSGEQVASVPMNSGYLELKRNYYYSFTSQNMIFNFPEDLADGEYKLVLAFSDYVDGSGYNWQPVKVSQNLQSVMARVEGDKIYLSGGAKPGDDNLNQTIKLDGVYSESAFPQEISQYSDFTVTASLQNTGKYGFNGSVSLCYMDLDGKTLFYSAPITCEIPSGGKQTVNIVDNVGNKLNAGEYLLSVVYNAGYLGSTPLEVVFDNGKQHFGIEVIQNEAPKLRLLSAQTEVPDTVNVEKGIDARVMLENIGNNNFSGRVSLVLEYDGQVYYESSAVSVDLPGGESTPVNLRINNMSPGFFNWHVVVKSFVDEKVELDEDTECKVLVCPTVLFKDLSLPWANFYQPYFPETGDFQIVFWVHNAGKELFEKELSVAMIDQERENLMSLMFTDGPVTVAPGDSARVRVTGNLEGKWPKASTVLLHVIDLEEGKFDEYMYWETGYKVVEGITGITDASTTPVLSVDEKSSVYVNTCEIGKDYDMTLAVLNHGTDFEGEVFAVLKHGYGMIHLEPIPVSLKQGQEAFIPYKFNVPDKIAPGTYKFGYVVKYSNEPNASYQDLNMQTQERFITVTASTPEPTEPELKVVQGETTSLTEFVKTTDYDMELTLQNDGADFNDDVHVVLWDGEISLYHEQIVSMNVPKGQKVKSDYTWNIPASVPAGQYMLSYALVIDGLYNFITIDDSGTTGIYVEVNENAEGPILSLVNSQTTVPSVVYQNTDFTARTVLQNTGGSDFKGEVCLLVLTSDGNVKYNTKPFLQVDVPAKGSVPLNIEGNVGNLALGNYYVAFATVKDLTPTLLYYDTGGNVTNVEVQKSLTSLPGTEDDSKSLRIYYSNPVQNFVTIRGSEVLERISVYTLAGTKVFEEDSPASNEYSIDMSYWNQGTYVLVVQTKTLKRTIKLLKK